MKGSFFRGALRSLCYNHVLTFFCIYFFWSIVLVKVSLSFSVYNIIWSSSTWWIQPYSWWLVPSTACKGFPSKGLHHYETDVPSRTLAPNCSFFKKYVSWNWKREHEILVVHMTNPSTVHSAIFSVMTLAVKSQRPVQSYNSLSLRWYSH